MKRPPPPLPSTDLSRFAARVREYADRIVISVEPGGADAYQIVLHALFVLRDRLEPDLTGVTPPRDMGDAVLGALGTRDVPKTARAAEELFTALKIAIVPRAPRPQA